MIRIAYLACPSKHIVAVVVFDEEKQSPAFICEQLILEGRKAKMVPCPACHSDNLLIQTIKTDHTNIVDAYEELKTQGKMDDLPVLTPPVPDVIMFFPDRQYREELFSQGGN